MSCRRTCLVVGHVLLEDMYNSRKYLTGARLIGRCVLQEDRSYWRAQSILPEREFIQGSNGELSIPTVQAGCGENVVFHFECKYVVHKANNEAAI